MACAALLAPTAMATWRGLGSYEPDTRWDEVGGYMFTEANAERVEKVYLNVVPMQRETAVNPNTGATGSRVLTPGNLEFQAIYGTWIDCNKDGYVGHAESVLFDYQAQLLLDTSLCPSGAYGGNDMYNQQGWVSELRWIANYVAPGAYGGFDGNQDGIPDGRDGRVIRDLGAHIWGDFGVPGDTMGREICPRDPTRGATERTGAFLTWADCLTSHRLWDAADGALTPVGLGFEEEDDFDQPGHPLNIGTLGADDGGQTMVGVWDCNDERDEVQTGQSQIKTQPTNYSDPLSGTTNTLPWFQVIDEDGHLNITGWSAGTYGDDWRQATFFNFEPVLPRDLAPGNPNTGGSAAGTYNHTMSGSTNDGCGSRARVYDNVESGTVPEKSGAKNRVTVRFTYYEEQRSGASKKGGPFYGGQLYPIVRSGNLLLIAGTQWYATSNAPSELGANGPTPPQLVRTSDLQPEGGLYWSFYANLTSESLTHGLQVPPSAPGIYGNEWCSRSSDPKTNGGFVCDADLWYVRPDGSRQDTTFWPLPGQAYHLRDVDCFDGTLVRGTPARASLADLNPSGACADAAN